MQSLYTEVLHRNSHAIGADAWDERELADVFVYLQQAFGLDNETHKLLLHEVSSRERPSTVLSVDVQEANIFTPTDINGLSDPFCVLYLLSAANQRQNTTIQQQTLNPVWNEKFLLSVENIAEDVLCVEVWDYDPEESLPEKLFKITQVKNVRTMKRLVKEVAGKSMNEFIGHCLIPLKDIPSAGSTIWYKLNKPGKDKVLGDIKLRLLLGFETDSQSAFEEFKQLFRVLLQHSLEQQENSDGRLSLTAEKILIQQSVQCGLSTPAVALAKWVEYTEFQDRTSLSEFCSLLETLVQPFQEGLFDKKKENQFWECTKKLLPCWLTTIKAIPAQCPEELNAAVVTLKILSTLNSLQCPQDLLPLCGSVHSDNTKVDIRAAVIDIVEQEILSRNTELIKVDDSSDEETKLKNLLEIINSMASSVEYANKHLDVTFQKFFSYPYALSVYRISSGKFAEVGMPIVTKICKTTYPIKFNDNSEYGIFDSDPLSIGTILFDVYQGLKTITRLGNTLSGQRAAELPLEDFYSWFYWGVIQWLYMAEYKALHCVQRCVDKDNLDSEEKHCISAQDMTCVLHGVKWFLKQLDWPLCDDSYTFTTKVVDDMHECLLFYADNIIKKAEMINDEEVPFRITGKWCKAINGILYTQEALASIVEELELGKIIAEITSLKNSSSAETCNETIQSLLRYSNESIKTKIFSAIERATTKMVPETSRLIKEIAKGGNMNTLTRYLDDSLKICHEHLRPNHFASLLYNVWEHAISIIKQSVQDGLKMGSPEILYTNLQHILKKLTQFLEQEESTRVFRDLHEQLTLCALETSDLIYQYYLDCLSEQNKLTAETHGSLTVKLMFLEEILKIEVLHANKLPPVCPKRPLNPYVKIQLVPEDKFMGHKVKSEPHIATQFPLFEKQFLMQMDAKQLEKRKGMVRFEVKHANRFGITWANKFLVEAFVSLADIPSAESGSKFQDLPHIRLKLNYPSNTDSEAFKVLESRQDPMAVNFVKYRKELFEKDKTKPTFQLYVKNENSLYTVYNSSAYVRISN